MLHDVRLALRAIRHAPAFAIAGCLTFAVGVGATTAIFSVLYAVMLRPLPYADPARLVVLLHGGRGPVSPADFLDYQRDTRSYVSMAAAQAWGASLSGTGEPERLAGLQVSPHLFETVGVGAALGRTFLAGEDQPGRDHVVVLGHALWTRRFGADPGVIGRTIRLDGEAYTIVGVMPASFQFAPFWVTNAVLWRPLTLTARTDDRAGRSLRLFARLRPDVSLETAQSEASTMAARLAAAYPSTNARVDISVVPLHEMVVAGVRPTLWLLGGTVALVLLVACVNVASLQLVRGIARMRELAVRAALGAGRRRLVWQLVTESLVLSAIGGTAGIVLAVWAGSSIAALAPPGSFPRQHELGFDPWVLAFAAAAMLVSGTAAGLLPAIQLSRANVQDALRDGARTASEGGRGHRLRRGLLAVELALAMALLAGAGLMGRTLLHLQGVDPGFDPTNVISFTVSTGGTPHAAPEALTPFFDRVDAGLRSLPGVTAAGAINHLPLGGDVWRFRFHPEGAPEPPPNEQPRATWRVVRPGYFETMRIIVAAGRSFDERDRAGTLPVAIVNETMARQHWHGVDPIGRRVRIGGDPDDPWYTIVGITADTRQGEWTGVIPEEIYVPHAQHTSEFGATELTFVVRTAGDAADMAGTVSRIVQAVDSSVPVSNVAPMEQVIADRLWRSRLSAALLGAFAMVGLVLAALGVYGVSAYAMSRRTREIGIRVALGARPADVVSLVVGETIPPVITGMAAGLIAALALARLIGSLLYDVAPSDPLTFAGAALALALVALIAGWLPARRASRIDPIVVLKDA